MPKDESKRPRMVVEEVVEEKPVVTIPDAEVVKEVEEKVEVPEDVVNEEVLSDNIVENPLPPTEPPTEVLPDLLPQLKSSSDTNPLVIIIPGIFLLGALLGGIYFYQASVTTQKGTVPSPSPTTTVTVINQPTPAASSSATIDLTKYPINIMNGSGIVGEAGKVKTLVETAGFTVSKTGNAASYDFTKTVIKAKADVPAEFLAKLTDTLSKSYVLDANGVLAISSPDIIQVIVGSTKAK